MIFAFLAILKTGRSTTTFELFVTGSVATQCLVGREGLVANHAPKLVNLGLTILIALDSVIVVGVGIGAIHGEEYQSEGDLLLFGRGGEIKGGIVRVPLRSLLRLLFRAQWFVVGGDQVRPHVATEGPAAGEYFAAEFALVV